MNDDDDDGDFGEFTFWTYATAGALALAIIASAVYSVLVAR